MIQIKEFSQEQFLKGETRTVPKEVEPLGKNWRQVSREIASRFPSQEYVLWGANLYIFTGYEHDENGHYKDRLWGCVGEVLDKLELPLTLKRDACFEVDYRIF